MVGKPFLGRASGLSFYPVPYYSRNGDGNPFQTRCEQSPGFVWLLWGRQINDLTFIRPHTWVHETDQGFALDSDTFVVSVS